MTINKRDAIHKHFREAYEHVLGSYSVTTPREIFYRLREIILKQYGLDISENEGYYNNHFSREVLTEEFERDPTYEETIYLNGRLKSRTTSRSTLGEMRMYDFVRQRSNNQMLNAEGSLAKRTVVCTHNRDQKPTAG